MSTIGIWNSIHHSVSRRKYSSSSSSKSSETKESVEQPYVSPGFSFDPKRREANMARIQAENARLAGLDSELGIDNMKSNEDDNQDNLDITD